MNRLKIAALCAVLSASAVVGSAAQARDNDVDGRGTRMERFCSREAPADMSEREARVLDRTTERLKLTDAQKSAFKDYQDARTKGRADMKTALCATKPDLSTLPGRLAFRQKMTEQRLASMKTTNDKLLAFYNALDADQKGKFDSMREFRGRWRHHRHHHRHWHRHGDWRD